MLAVSRFDSPLRVKLLSFVCPAASVGQVLQEKRLDSFAGLEAKKRRAHPRYNISANAEAVELHSDARIRGRVSDISAGGCYLEVMSIFPVGSKVHLRISTDEKDFSAEAKVLFATEGIGLGVGFTEIEPGQRHILEGWLGELSGEVTSDRQSFRPDKSARTGANSVDHHQRNVLNELIIALIRKRVLTDVEGRELMMKLLL